MRSQQDLNDFSKISIMIRYVMIYMIDTIVIIFIYDRDKKLVFKNQMRF